MINCILVDDEPLARDVLRIHLQNFTLWNIVAECMNAAEAFVVLQEKKVDVMFLDINMPGIKGNDFVRSLKSPPLVVLTTAYTGYAIEGFDLNVVDYLLKPINLQRFRQAIEKAEQQLSHKHNTEHPTLQPIPAGLNEEFFFLKHDNKQVKIAYDDILYLEARRDFTMLHLKSRKILAGFHLKVLEEMLPSTRFLRVHRSYMVSIKAITAVQGNIIDMEGQQIPISPNFKAALFATLKIS